MAAEWDASTLREKYGEPLARETYQVRPNLEMVVRYGPARQVCRIELPHTASKQEVDEVIEELVPPSIRGKEIGKGLKIIGGCSLSYVDYEHIFIWHSENATPRRRHHVQAIRLPLTHALVAKPPHPLARRPPPASHPHRTRL